MIRSSPILPALLFAAGVVALPIVAPSQAVAADEVSADQIAENYAALLERDYVYPEIGKRYSAALRAGIAAGRYSKLTGEALGQAIDKDITAVSPDGHLRLRLPEAIYNPPAPAPGAAVPNRAPKVPVEQPGWIAPGIAFVRFNVFPDDASVTEQAAKFMADHADATAIIFDIRTHNGGGLSQMDVILPWLFAKPTRLVTMATRASVEARGNSWMDAVPSLRKVQGDADMAVREHWVAPGEDTRLRDAKVYVLTSGATASAAEHFSLAMKHTGRGTLVGAPTAGANHFGTGEDLGGGYGAFIPVGRTYDPKTGKDWEGDGVQPDIAVAPADALVRVLTDLGVASAEAKRLSDAHMPSRPMERRKPRGAKPAG